MTVATTTPATDVHQHLWPEGFLGALSRRAAAPAVRRDGRGWRVRVPGEPDSPFGPAAHDAGVRAADLRASGLQRALLCMSTPLGVEALPEDEARPLLDAWHDGVFAAGAPFRVWGALPVHGAAAADVDALLDRGAVGVSLPAALLGGPAQVAAAGPLLARLEARGAPLLIHPGPVAAPPAATSGAAWWPALTTYVSDMHVAWHAFAAFGRPEHPALRVCFAMLAGLAPLHAERLALRGGAFARAAAVDPYCFYDTSSYGQRAIGAMAGVVGLDQLVTGSDRPVVDPPVVHPLGEHAATVTTTTNVHRLLTGRSA